MMIEEYFDSLTKKDVIHNKVFEGSRAIIMNEEKKLLVIYEKKLDIYVFPGGRKEGSETNEETMKREVLEETGYKVLSSEFKVTIKEYFLGETWVNHYFVITVDLKNQQQPSLTKEEQSYGMEYHWMSPLDLLTLLDEYDSSNVYGKEIHNREFLGLIHSIS